MNHLNNYTKGDYYKGEPDMVKDPEYQDHIDEIWDYFCEKYTLQDIYDIVEEKSIGAIGVYCNARNIDIDEFCYTIDEACELSESIKAEIEAFFDEIVERLYDEMNHE